MPVTKPGQIVFARTNGAMGKLIRFGEFLRLKKGSQFNHVAIISDDVDVYGEPLIIQATLRGVTGDAPLSSLGDKVLIVDPPKGVNAKKVVAFAKNQVGLRYGYLTILAIALDILTWDWFPAFRGARKPSWVCSALAMESLRYGGLLYDVVDIYTVTPQDAYLILTQ